MIALMREESQKSMEHETMLIKMMLSTNYSVQQQQGYGVSNVPQQMSGMLEQSVLPNQAYSSSLPLNILHQQMYNQIMSTAPLHTDNQRYGSYGEQQEYVGINVVNNQHSLSNRSFRPVSPVGRPLSSCSSSSSSSSSATSTLDGQIFYAHNYHKL